MIFLETEEEDAKLHSFLEPLDWLAIDELSHSERCGQVVSRHINDCPDCQKKRNEVVDAKLAAMSAERRQWLIGLGQQLAEKFTAEHRR